MIKLSKRLQLVASFVPDDCFLIDVGCDHALLSIYLKQTKKNIQIIASDIHDNPLKSAIQNIKKYNMEGEIKVLKKDGIENLEKEIDTVLISGMGGKLITKILNSKDLNYVKNLILAPNNDFLLVRKHLNKIGFKIMEEKLITEKGITYLVIHAVVGYHKTNFLFFDKPNSFLSIVFNMNFPSRV